MNFFGNPVEALTQDAHNNSTPDTLQSLQFFSEEVGNYASATADHIWISLFGAIEEVENHTRSAEDSQKAGNHTGRSMEWESVKEWAKKHRGQITGAAVVILGPPAAVAAVPAVLGGLGFTAAGVAAGSAGASFQAGVDNVAAGSCFAILQSAAAGGCGATLVNGVVGGTAAVAALAANIPNIVGAVNEGKSE